METKRPVEGHFGSEFSAICNRCGVMAAWSHKTLSFCEQFLHFFFGKTTPYGKILKILFWKFSLPHRSTLLCSNVVKFSDGKSVKSCVIYLTKTKTKFQLPLKLSLLHGLRPKSSHGQPPTMCSQCSRFHPDRFTFGAFIAECVNIVFLPGRVFPWMIGSLSP